MLISDISYYHNYGTGHTIWQTIKCHLKVKIKYKIKKYIKIRRSL